MFTFPQKFACKVFNAYHCWRRGLLTFPNDKLYPTISDIFITWKWKRRDYFLSFIIWTTSNNATLVNHDLTYYHHSIVLPIPHKQKFITPCLQINSRFHSLSTFIFLTTDLLHAKRAQNDEYAQTLYATNKTFFLELNRTSVPIVRKKKF